MNSLWIIIVVYFVHMCLTMVVHVYAIKSASYNAQNAIGTGPHPGLQESASLAHRRDLMSRIQFGLTRQFYQLNNRYRFDETYM